VKRQQVFVTDYFVSNDEMKVLNRSKFSTVLGFDGWYNSIDILIKISADVRIMRQFSADTVSFV
jgi:hypothetical protein